MHLIFKIIMTTVGRVMSVCPDDIVISKIR